MSPWWEFLKTERGSGWDLVSTLVVISTGLGLVLLALHCLT